MNINFKQSQFELFPHSPADAPDPHKSKFLFSSITLSFENIIILTVCLFMVIILSFSIGVERGKIAALPSGDEPIKQQAALEQESRTMPSQTIIPEEPKVSVVAQASVEPASENVSEKPLQDYFTVQVASFKTNKYAEKEAQSLKQKGYESFVIPKGKYIIVCAGKFLTNLDAKGFITELKYKYKDCLVRRL
ncbi:MAG: SPOR domain-containing protein [Candidatus Aceula meridiana]|nr:SPOR domain-containing protein [Candidatus Aceula meridiana]